MVDAGPDYAAGRSGLLSSADLTAAKAALSKYSFLNGDKACALGASYGGFMAYWIAGNWQQPWKCIVAHDGVFDNRMMGYETEELWFSEWENGGTPYDNPKGYEQFNPITHVKDWSVPMLTCSTPTTSTISLMPSASGAAGRATPSCWRVCRPPPRMTCSRAFSITRSRWRCSRRSWR